MNATMPINNHQIQNDTLGKNVSKLVEFCSSYDTGIDSVVKYIAERISKIVSDIDNINLLSTAFPLPKTKQFTMGWNFGNNISFVQIPSDRAYVGLIIKSIENGVKGYTIKYIPKEDRHPYVNKKCTKEVWLEEPIYWDTVNENKLTRKQVLDGVSNNDNISNEVRQIIRDFKSPELFTINSNSPNITYINNPLSASIRQMAWEVLDSLKEKGLYGDENDGKLEDKQKEKNDFYGRMNVQKEKGLAAPLTGEGTDFLKSVMKYALENSHNYIYFHLPLFYQDVITECLKEIKSANAKVHGIFFRVTPEEEIKNNNIPEVKIIDSSKLPFIIYDDEYYAVEGSDDNGSKIWIANLRSKDNVMFLKEFFEKMYK